MVFIGNFKRMLGYMKTCGKAQEDRLCHRLSRVALTRASLARRTSSRKSAKTQISRRWTPACTKEMHGQSERVREQTGRFWCGTTPLGD